MDAKLTVRNIDITPSERRRLCALNGRMQHYFRNVLALSWEISGAKHACVANCRVQAQSGYFRASVTAGRPGAAMDLAFEKVVRQRRRVHVKAVTGRSRSGVSGKRRLQTLAIGASDTREAPTI